MPDSTSNLTLVITSARDEPFQLNLSKRLWR